MSLLEEALRRHDALSQRHAETPGSTASRDRPAAAPALRADRPRPPAPHPPRAPASPCPELATTPAGAPLQAHVVAVVAPLLILLLFAGLAWLMLRTGRTDRTDPRRPRETAPELRPETSPAPGAMYPVAVATNGVPLPVAAADRPQDLPDLPVPSVPPAPPPPAVSTAAAASAGAAPDAPVAAGAPDAVPPWPLVAIKGIASGRERLVVLDTGEMLSAGERSRTGVRVVRIEPDCAWIAWHGATNMLRKGEDSSKPLLE
jgi:hypothetical protein